MNDFSVPIGTREVPILHKDQDEILERSVNADPEEFHFGGFYPVKSMAWIGQDHESYIGDPKRRIFGVVI